MAKSDEDSYKRTQLMPVEPILVDSAYDNHSKQNDFEVNLTLPEARERLGQQRLLDIIENYLSYYAAGQGHTARAKRYDLNHFLAFIAGNRLPASVSVSEWTLQATKDFIDSRLSIGESPATVSRRLATVKHFGRTLAERVSGYINPAREARGPTIQTSKPHGLSSEELSLLREASQKMLSDKPKEFVNIRNHTIIELFLATGLRADEVRLLSAGQISEDLSWLRNVKTKGRKFRNVYLDSGIRDLLSSYLEARTGYLTAKFPSYAQLTAKELKLFPVFVSSYGARLDDPRSCGVSAKSVWRIVSGLGKVASSMAEANSMPNIHPHKLRHTFAHGLLDSSKDVRLVAQALGHSDVRTTMRYTERTEEEIAKAIEKKVSSET